VIGRGDRRARIQFRQLGAITLLACAFTPIFNVLTSAPTVQSAVQGLVDGVLISGLVGGYLLFLRDGYLRSWFRRRVAARLCGELALRGKEAPVAAFSLTGPPAPA
jgi:hypothetical protein